MQTVRSVLNAVALAEFAKISARTPASEPITAINVDLGLQRRCVSLIVLLFRSRHGRVQRIRIVHFLDGLIFRVRRRLGIGALLRLGCQSPCLLEVDVS